MARKPYPSEAAEKLLIRFPEGMRAKIAEAAKAAGRSMNAEVIARLEATLGQDSAFEELTALVDEHEQRIKELERDVYRALDHAGLLHDYR